MKAGRLRDMIGIWAPVVSDDGTGGQQIDFILVAQRHGSIVQTTGREYWAGGGELSEGNIRISVRELAGPEFALFGPEWRLTNIDTGEQYQIVSVLPNRLGNDWTIVCKLGGAKHA